MINQSFSGVLCVDKPAGFTSFDVVAKLRGILKTRKIGHSGTLDPMATGVLPVFVGKATRAIDLLEDHDKAYLAQIKLGLTTDTLDITGSVLSQMGAEGVTQQDFLHELAAFSGEILQTPPMYSALKVGGKKLYELARSGIEVERQARPVTIYETKVTAHPAPDTYEVFVSCSKGTYIRSLADDLGKALGCGAVLSGLRRVKACGFGEADCLTLEEIQSRADAGTLSLLPVERLFEKLPRISLTDVQEKRFCNGAALSFDRLPEICLAEGERCAVFGDDNMFLGLGISKEGELRSYKLFLP